MSRKYGKNSNFKGNKNSGRKSKVEEFKNMIERINIVNEMVDRREKAIQHLTDEKLEKEKAKDLTDIIDKLTKNIQLLGGKPTEIINDYSQYSDEELIRRTKSGSRTSEEGISEKTS